MTTSPNSTPDDGSNPIRPLHELRDSGLLWLINTSVFHPRGYTLGLHYNGDEVDGWQLFGDGSEPWTMPDDALTHQRFRDASALLGGAQGEVVLEETATVDFSVLPPFDEISLVLARGIPKQHAEAVAKAFIEQGVRTGYHPPLLVFTDADVELATIDEAAMNAAGWFRQDNA